MKIARRLLIVVLLGYLLFGHNPANWEADVSGKSWTELESLFGEPTFTCSEVGTCKIWVSGYDLFGLYLFPSVMSVGYEGSTLTKRRLYLPLYNATLHRSFSSRLFPDL